MSMPKIRPLENRPFRFKQARAKFHCPLCASERYLCSHHLLDVRQYLQIVVLTGLFTYFLFDVVAWRGLSMVFVFWGAYEAVNRLLYRSEIACPYCGFDASWYGRDVKVARGVSAAILEK